MKNLKKVLALVLAFVFILGTVATAAYTDVPADAKYLNAAELLEKLNIMNGTDKGFEPDKTLTRAEAARLVHSLATELGGLMPQTDTKFKDVPKTNWASGYINDLSGKIVNEGVIISGVEDGTNFAPSAELSYDAVNKLITVALGYEPVAKKRGSWTGGYRAAAEQAKLYNNTYGKVTYGGSNIITRAEMAILVANALIANPVVEEGISTIPNYKVDTTETLAGQRGLTVNSGVIAKSGDKFTIGGGAAVKPGTSVIAKSIGLNATAFIQDGVVVALTVTGARESLATGTAITVKDQKLTMNKVEYTVTDAANITVNGVTTKLADISKFTDLTVNDKFTIYGTDKTVTEIVVEAYDYAVIDSILVTINRVKFVPEKKAGFSILIDSEKNFLTKDGEAIKVKDLAKGNFVKMLLTTVPVTGVDATYKIEVLTENTFEGTAKSQQGSKVVIDGETYTINTNAPFNPTVTLGKVATFTLDGDNKIIAFEAKTAAAADKFIANVLGVTTFVDAFDNTTKMSVKVNMGGTVTTYTTKTKVEGTKAGNAAFEIATKYYTPQLDNDKAIVTLGAKKTVNGINNNVAHLTFDKDNKLDTISFPAVEKVGGTLTFNASLKKLGSAYLSDKTKVYTTKDTNTFVENEISYLKEKVTYEDVYQIVDNGGTATAIFLLKAGTGVDTAKYAIAIDSISSNIDENGVLFSSVKVLVEGKEVTLTTTSKTEFANIGKGDYFTYQIDKTTGEAVNITEIGTNLGSSLAAIKADKDTLVLPALGNDNYIVTDKKGVTVSLATGINSEGAFAGTITKDIASGVVAYVYDGKDFFASTVGAELAKSELELKTIADGKTAIAVASYNLVHLTIVDGEVTEVIIVNGITK